MTKRVTLVHVTPSGRDTVTFGDVGTVNVTDAGAFVMESGDKATVFAPGFWAYADIDTEEK
jgi:hypothetical protein